VEGKAFHYLHTMRITAALSLLSLAYADVLFPFSARQPVRDAKQTYVRNLVSRSIPTANSQLGGQRQLQNNNNQDDNYKVDISSYSVKFEMCQFVKAFSDELAEEADSETVLDTERFVIFRLCPNHVCGTCNYNYGEYLVSLDEYLQATVAYFQDQQEEMCQACDQCQNQADDGAGAADAGGDDKAAEEAAYGDDAAGDDGGKGEGRGRQLYSVDCSTCYDECQKIANMQENGYIDATEFLQCQMIYDPQDDNKGALYAGPICASSGSKIKIGVFTDANCLYLDSTKEVDDYLVDANGNQMKLSHALLKQTYSDTCISCLEPSNQNDNKEGNDAQDQDKVMELCEELYNDAAKCEKTHGFESGYGSYYGYENQLAQESVVCDFIQSLKSGTYDEEGEIIVSGASSSSSSAASTTPGQKFALCFFVIGTMSLAIYAAVLHSKLVKGARAVEFNPSKGAFA